MPRPGNENPYWSEYVKGHIFSSEEISELCHLGFNTMLATRSISTYWNEEELDDGIDPHWEHPLLVLIHQNSAEADVSGALLKLAVLYRSLDDQLKGVEEFRAFQMEQHKKHGRFLTVYSDDKINDSLRECCNKIIHADDIRAVYQNDGDRHENKGVWYMASTIELTGTLRREKWTVSIEAFTFFEAMLETAMFVEEDD